MIYLSHGAAAAKMYRRCATIPDTEWFIVEPRHDADQLAVQIHSLLSVGRTVRAVDSERGTVRDLTLSEVPWRDAMQDTLARVQSTANAPERPR
jgi:hypothetical protein